MGTAMDELATIEERLDALDVRIGNLEAQRDEIIAKLEEALRLLNGKAVKA